MVWAHRPGVEPEQQLNELEKTLGLDNLKDIQVKTDFPVAGQQEPQITIVNDSGTYYLVFLSGGNRYRAELTSF